MDFFLTISCTRIFFLGTSVCMIFFSPYNILQDFFVCVFSGKSRLSVAEIKDLSTWLNNLVSQICD